MQTKTLQVGTRRSQQLVGGGVGTNMQKGGAEVVHG